MEMVPYQPLLFQPVQSEVGFSLSELLHEVRATHFPEIEGEIEVRISAERPLAYVWPRFMGVDAHLVVFHPVLNHPQTPVEVLRFLCKHELTHLVCSGSFIDGRFEAHDDAFWEHERKVGPEGFAVWRWIRANIGSSVHYRGGRLGVSRRWRSLRERPRTPYTPSLPFDGERWDIVCPGAGGQLALPPSWAVRPLPFVP
ncbi:MAG: hypothetical protein HYX53_04580 [Chloroflexi bacterium]|nr:hypothetical protein [Chloroflexota bacterium]